MNNCKKNDSLLSYHQDRLETEICHNLEIFEDRSKLIISDLEDILSFEQHSSKLTEFKSNKNLSI